MLDNKIKNKINWFHRHDFMLLQSDICLCSWSLVATQFFFSDLLRQPESSEIGFDRPTQHYYRFMNSVLMYIQPWIQSWCLYSKERLANVEHCNTWSELAVFSKNWVCSINFVLHYLGSQLLIFKNSKFSLINILTNCETKI